MSDNPTPTTPNAPPRRRTMLLAALTGSAALHAALIFGPDFAGRAPDPDVVAVMPVHQLPPEPVTPSEPEPVREPAPTPEPTPQPEATPVEPQTPPPPPEPTPTASEPLKPEPPAPAPPRLDPTPQPPTADASQPAADDTSSGSFAGNTKGRRGPSLRIDWGSPADARGRIQRGGLQLAVLNVAGGARVSHAVHLNPDDTARRDSAPALHRFDPEARIVGDAPAFASAARSLSLNPNEHLVILLPRALADQARLAQRTFVRRQGHRWEDVAVTTAVLDPASNGLRARVTGLHPVQ